MDGVEVLYSGSERSCRACEQLAELMSDPEFDLGGCGDFDVHGVSFR